VEHVGLLQEGINFYEEYEVHIRYFESEKMSGKHRFWAVLLLVGGFMRFNLLTGLQLLRALGLIKK